MNRCVSTKVAQLIQFGDIRIREADLADEADGKIVLSLLNAYAADPMGSTKARLISALRQVPGRLVLLAFRGVDAVGIAVCFSGFSTFRAQPLLNVHDLSVLPDYRGHGIGVALLAAVEAEA